MKTSEFLSAIRKIIREEVQLAVRKEMQVLREGVKPKAPTNTATKKPVRTTPLVTLEEDFKPVGMQQISTGNGVLDSLLNETAHSLNNPDEFDPELPYTSQQTNMFVKDYSSILKRAEELR